MKFTISLNEMQKLLQKVLPAIPPKSTLPVLEHLNFSLNDNKLRIIATDQDITIMTTSEVGSGEDGGVLVPGRKLNDIVKALGSEGEFEFTSDPVSNVIKIIHSKGQFTLKGLSPDQYLDLPLLFGGEAPDPTDTSEGKESIFFKKEEISRLAGKTSFAVSTDEYRPAMTGVLFQFRGDHVNAVSTDSYRLVRAIHRPDGENLPGEFDIIIPSRSVELLEKVEDDLNMSVIESNGKPTHVRFDIGNMVFISRIIDERFPPYESVIPQNNKIMAEFDQKEALSAIKRVSLVTSIVSKQIKLKFSEGMLNFSGEDEESGNRGNEEIKCEFSGEEFEIGFNYRFLEEALQHAQGDGEDAGTVKMALSEPAKPALIMPKSDGEDLLMLIMPVRIG
ncbi:MAG: DNA polymerase III subunit beta [Candidatus Kapaibacterium sp.]